MINKDLYETLISLFEDWLLVLSDSSEASGRNLSSAVAPRTLRGTLSPTVVEPTLGDRDGDGNADLWVWIAIGIFVGMYLVCNCCESIAEEMKKATEAENTGTADATPEERDSAEDPERQSSADGPQTQRSSSVDDNTSSVHPVQSIAAYIKTFF